MTSDREALMEIAHKLEQAHSLVVHAWVHSNPDDSGLRDIEKQLAAVMWKVEVEYKKRAPPNEG